MWHICSQLNISRILLGDSGEIFLFCFVCLTKGKGMARPAFLALPPSSQPVLGRAPTLQQVGSKHGRKTKSIKLHCVHMWCTMPTVFGQKAPPQGPQHSQVLVTPLREVITAPRCCYPLVLQHPLLVHTPCLHLWKITPLRTLFNYPLSVYLPPISRLIQGTRGDEREALWRGFLLRGLNREFKRLWCPGKEMN